MNELGSVIEQLSLTVDDQENIVSFAGQHLKLDSEEDAKPIVDAIRNCPGMTMLILEGNTIGVLAAKAIAKALESQPKFRKALWSDMFTQRTEHEIPDALNYLSSGIILANAQLVELDLSDNAFGPRGLKGIVNLLKSPSCFSLKELRFNNNGLGIAGAKMLATALCQCVTKSREAGTPLSLKVFVCGRNRLENEGSLALANFIKEVGTLEYVAMTQNGINPPGITGLAEAFANNPNLKFLSLEDNTFTKIGAEAMAKHLPVLKNLETINFGDCLLKTPGAIAIGKALKNNNPNLKALFLGYNEIRAEGAIVIVEALADKMQFEKLDLNGNKLGESGIQVVEDHLRMIGNVDILGSLSGDEGSDDEDEESAEEEAIDEDDEEEKDEEIVSTTVDDFLTNPTAVKLNTLFKEDVDLDEFLSEDPSLVDCFNLFMKIAGVVKSDDNKYEDAAFHYTELLFEKAFTLFGENNIWVLNNELGVCLGLIKGEDRGKKTNLDINGALYLLNRIIRQKYFHQTTKLFLRELLSKPVEAKIDFKIKHNILQALYV